MRELHVRLRVRGREREPGCVSERVLLPWRNQHGLSGGQLVCRGVSAASRVHLQRRLREYSERLECCMRRHVVDVLVCRLRRGPRVRGRRRTASGVHMHSRVRVHINYDNSVRGEQRHVRRMRRRLHLRGRHGAARSLQLQRRARVHINYDNGVRGEQWHVRRVPARLQLRGGCFSARVVPVRARKILWHEWRELVRSERLQCLPRWLELQRRSGAAEPLRRG